MRFRNPARVGTRPEAKVPGSHDKADFDLEVLPLRVFQIRFGSQPPGKTDGLSGIKGISGVLLNNLICDWLQVHAE